MQANWFNFHHSSATIKSEFEVGLIVRPNFVTEALELKTADLDRIVLCLFAKHSIMFGHQFVGFSKHSIERLLLAILHRIQSSDAGNPGQHQTVQRVLRFSSLTVSGFAADDQLGCPLESTQRLIQNDRHAHFGQILADEFAYYFPNGSHFIQLQIRQLRSRIFVDEDMAAHELFLVIFDDGVPLLNQLGLDDVGHLVILLNEIIQGVGKSD